MRKSAIKNNLLKDDKNYVRSEVLLVPTGDYLQKDRRSVYATFRDVVNIFGAEEILYLRQSILTIKCSRPHRIAYLWKK